MPALSGMSKAKPHEEAGAIPDEKENWQLALTT